MIPPDITIITVVRNDLEGLKKTVRSIQEQAFKSWELLIKDGDSQDGTRAFADNLAAIEPLIRVVEGSDKSIYDAMNMALAEARGEYVIMMNAGDTFYNYIALERAMNRMSSHPTPLGIGFFSSWVEMENGRQYERPSKPTSYIKYGQPAIHQSTIFRTRLHKLFPYSEGYPNIADFVTVAEQIKSGAKTASFPEYLARFEVKKKSNSYTNQALARREFRTAIKDIWAPPLWHQFYFRSRRYLATSITRLLIQ